MKLVMAFKTTLMFLFLTAAQQTLAAGFTPLSNIINSGACTKILQPGEDSKFKFSVDDMAQINKTIQSITQLGLHLEDPKT